MHLLVFNSYGKLQMLDYSGTCNMTISIKTPSIMERMVTIINARLGITTLSIMTPNDCAECLYADVAIKSIC
jgi:hypothetical protein